MDSVLGANSSPFTADRVLFLRNPSISLWRFEVVYSLPTQRSSSALNFVVNQPPSNGSCSISACNGTTLTLFSVSCPSWFDVDGIRHYSLFIHSNDSSSGRSMIAFSPMPDFDVYLPSSSDLRLLIVIRDWRDCSTEWTNLSSLFVEVESNAFDDLLLQSSNGFPPSNPFVQALMTFNTNRVGQVLSSLFEQLNRIDQNNLQKAVVGLSPTSVVVFSFDTSL